MKKEKQLLKQAEMLARTAESWADLANALYSPGEGILALAYPKRPEREAFMKTNEYRQIRALLSKLTERYGFLEGATPKKSGKFVVRLPQSLHAALEREARSEGVSLNQLVVAKLAVQLRDATSRKQRPA
jgi:hypothetical protein